MPCALRAARLADLAGVPPGPEEGVANPLLGESLLAAALDVLRQCGAARGASSLLRSPSLHPGEEHRSERAAGENEDGDADEARLGHEGEKAERRLDGNLLDGFSRGGFLRSDGDGEDREPCGVRLKVLVVRIRADISRGEVLPRSVLEAGEHDIFQGRALLPEPGALHLEVELGAGDSLVSYVGVVHLAVPTNFPRWFRRPFRRPLSVAEDYLDAGELLVHLDGDLLDGHVRSQDGNLFRPSRLEPFDDVPDLPVALLLVRQDALPEVVVGGRG